MSFDSFMRSMPFYGPIYGAVAGPSDEHEALQAQFQQMAEAYEKYRAQNADARTRQLGSQLQMFGPVQQMLSSMAPSVQPFDTRGAMNQFSGVTAGMGPAAAYQAPRK